MRVMVTGANGFVGRLLVERLLSLGMLRDRSIESLLILDQDLSAVSQDSRIRRHFGSVTDTALLRRVLADGVDVVFHLISIPGGAAETQYDLGYQVNLLASLELLDQLRRQPKPPVFIYASSIAVYGSSLTERLDENRLPRPQLSYAAHKLMVETALLDLARRGDVDGRALRLPGIVARPRQPNGLKSAFMSDIMWAIAEGESYCCPVSPEATAWWMSVSCCVDNLIHAAEIDPPVDSRVWQLPVLRASVGQVIDALAAQYGEDRRTLIEYAPDEELEAQFGRFPPLRASQAKALGFHSDGSLSGLVRRSLNPSALPRKRARTA